MCRSQGAPEASGVTVRRPVTISVPPLEWTVNRRGVLLGLGTAAAGSGAIFGSGAFTTLQADRNITIRLAEDENADIALKDTAITSDLVTNSTSANDNQIEFDFDSDGSGGINSNATARFGNSSNTTDVPGADLDSSVDVGAFKIVNNTDGTYDISVEIQFTGSGDVNSFSVFLAKTSGGNTTTAEAEPTNGNSDTATILDVAEGEEVQAALEIDTNDSIDQFDGTITITAERTNPTAS